MNWNLDRDAPDRLWNLYMKNYGDRYRLIKDEIGIWHLRCKYGSVQLSSLVSHLLCYAGEFRSVRHKNAFKKKCSFKHTITQEGDTDIVIMFNEDMLDSAAQALRLYRKKKISADYRKALAARMLEIRQLRRLDKS